MPRRPKAYIGTGSWDHPEWRGGFYPKRLDDGRRLPYLSRRLDTLELASPWYERPLPETVAHWSEAVSNRFRLAIRLWRDVLYPQRVDVHEEALQSFFEVFRDLPASQRGPLLIQVPQQHSLDLQGLEWILEAVRAHMRPQRWRVAVEFRDPTWVDRGTYALLDDFDAALCLHDQPLEAPVDAPNDASFVYVRRHGPGGGFTKGYGKTQIADDARHVRHWLDEGRDVFVYFLDDDGKEAPVDALRLKKAVQDLGSGAPDREQDVLERQQAMTLLGNEPW